MRARKQAQVFFDREYNPDELRRYCGSVQQIARITPYELTDGKERGVRCLDFRTGSGFNFSVVPGRGLDISFAEFNGRALSWISPTSVVAPEFYEPQGWGWIRGFFGGLLTTCGLVNVGVPDVYRNEPQGAHGRISYTPATNVSYDTVWAGDGLHLLAKGEMRETHPPHTNLLLRRRIQAEAGQRYLRIHDTVINEGFERTPHQILYHINAGFPIVSPVSRILLPSRVVTPRDLVADEAKEHYNFCHDTTPGFAEQVYFHELAPATDGLAWAGVVNPDLDGGLGLYVKFDTTNLPHLSQWKMMNEGMYVLGLEPSNTYGIGMNKQQARGVLRYLEPGEQVDYHVEIGVIAGPDEIEAFEREVAVVSPDKPEFASMLV